MQAKPTLFLTLPPVRPPSRRRDPLGFSDVASYYADLLAPGLTNRQRDARWLSILCWSIQQVQSGFSELDGGKQRYDRLRGLELRWVIETCRRPDEGKGRQLPGSEKIRKMNKTGVFSSLRQEMGENQWRRYQYVGPYAAYRGLLQSLNLLDGSGWQLTTTGKALAAVASKTANIQLRKTVLKRTGALADETTGWVSYWLRRWPLPAECAAVCAFLPTNRTALCAGELKLLAPALFEYSSIRRDVAESLGSATAVTHAALCKHLQKELLGKRTWAPEDRVKLRKFGDFAMLADTAVEALREAFNIVAQHSSGEPSPGEVADAMSAQLIRFRKKCDTWKSDGVWPSVDVFAQEIASATESEQILRRLVLFHERHASGLVWLCVKRGALDRSVRHAQAPGGYYRFRLDALGRLALGCDVIASVPPCFNPVTTTDPDENDE